MSAVPSSSSSSSPPVAPPSMPGPASSSSFPSSPPQAARSEVDDVAPQEQGQPLMYPVTNSHASTSRKNSDDDADAEVAISPLQGGHSLKHPSLSREMSSPTSVASMGGPDAEQALADPHSSSASSTSHGHGQGQVHSQQHSHHGQRALEKQNSQTLSSHTTHTNGNSNSNTTYVENDVNGKNNNNNQVTRQMTGLTASGKPISPPDRSQSIWRW